MVQNNSKEKEKKEEPEEIKGKPENSENPPLTQKDETLIELEKESFRMRIARDRMELDEIRRRNNSVLHHDFETGHTRVNDWPVALLAIGVGAAVAGGILLMTRGKH